MANIFDQAKAQDAALNNAVDVNALVGTAAQLEFEQNRQTQEQFMQQYRDARQKEDSISRVPDIILNIAKFVNPDFDKKALRAKKEDAVFEMNASAKNSIIKLQALESQRDSAVKAASLELSKTETLLKMGQEERLRKQAADAEADKKISDSPTKELQTLLMDKNNPLAGRIQKELNFREGQALQLRASRNSVAVGDITTADAINVNMLLQQPKDRFAQLEKEVNTYGTRFGFTIAQVAKAKLMRDAFSTAQAKTVTEAELADANLQSVVARGNAVMEALVNNGQGSEILAKVQASLEDIPQDASPDEKIAMRNAALEFQDTEIRKLATRVGLDMAPATLAMFTDDIENRVSYSSPLIAGKIRAANASSILGSSIFRDSLLTGMDIKIVAEGIPNPPEYIEKQLSSIPVIESLNTKINSQVTMNALISAADNDEFLKSVGGGVALAGKKNFNEKPINTFVNHVKHVLLAKNATEDQIRATALKAAEFIRQNAGLIATQNRDSLSMVDKSVLSGAFGIGDPYANVAVTLANTVQASIEDELNPSMFDSLAKILPVIAESAAGGGMLPLP